VEPLRYDTILFDADETLLDFTQAEAKSLHKVFSASGILFNSAIYENYRAINQKLWEGYEKGSILKNTITDNRFISLFSLYGIEADGVVFNKKYMKELCENVFLLPEAKEICQELSKWVRLYLVTNGPSKIQRCRVEKSGISKYFSGIFVSEEVGFQKPQKGFFDYVFSQIGEFDPKRTIIVGDSLTSDIAGGNNAGIDTCWYNPTGALNQKNVLPTYEIERLEQMWEICKITRFEIKQEMAQSV
jgi:2-haloacid dehalogenase